MKSDIKMGAALGLFLEQVEGYGYERIHGRMQLRFRSRMDMVMGKFSRFNSF